MSIAAEQQPRNPLPRNDRPWHAQAADEALGRLSATPEGLTAGEARRRLSEHGPNVLPRARREGPLALLWRQMESPLILVLIASGFVAMAVDWEGDGVKNGSVILAVVLLNSLVGFVQEHRASKAVEALARMVPENVTVLRGGVRTTVPASELVPGDVVEVASGDKVPADVRLLAVKGLNVDEAALTGESAPVRKQSTPTALQAALGDRVSMAWSGTLVTSGTGTGLVVETGEHTELGRISAMLQETTDLETPLTATLRQVGKVITCAIVAVAGVMLAVGTARTVAATGEPVLEALRETVIFAIALAVGAIPEGLPAIVTIALAIGVQRMARRGAVVRRLPAVETLGSTTVICSDKTGTLTRNEMTVHALWAPEAAEVLQLTGVGYEPRGDLVRGGETLETPPPDVERLVARAALCNDATLVEAEGRFEMTGDPTEGALVVAAEKLGLDVGALRRAHPRIDAVPFESALRFMATLHPAGGEGEGRRLVVKGAPEVVLRRCGRAAGGKELDRHAASRIVEDLGNRGMRVLAVAERALPESRAEIGEEDAVDLSLVGLIGMIDPPRTEVMDAIRACRQAGVRVKMITGDHRATARAIGEQLEILDGEAAVTGQELSSLTADEVADVAVRSNVFARVAPEHKLTLVRALQSRGHVVAVTGDGVNDAPALKQANVGVAMGITGTSVSKESAAIVLTDDNFASIAAAVEEGRRVYDNLVKSLAFVLPTNLGLALVLLVAVALFPFDPRTDELLLPMSPLQLLWINLVATVSLALPLAFEAHEPDAMRRPPRPPDAPVLSRFVQIRTLVVALLMTLAAVGLFAWEYQGELARGVDPDFARAEAQTLAVTSVIVLQTFYVFNCRSLRASVLQIGFFSNRIVFLGVATLALLQIGFIYVPAWQSVFETAPLGGAEWAAAIGVGAVVLPVIAVEKWLRSRGRLPGVSRAAKGGRRWRDHASDPARDTAD